MYLLRVPQHGARHGQVAIDPYASQEEDASIHTDVLEGEGQLAEDTSRGSNRCVVGGKG